jgi:pyridoxal phosphate enzyme (YggS family)
MSEASTAHKEALLKRLQQVRQRLRDAEARFGREPGSVLLLPVSKTRPAEDIAQVAATGLHAFGESYLQEALEKIETLTSLDLQWHFIGPIQSNKTRPIAENFHWVHSVDRMKIAHRLHEQRPAHLPALNICLQINISGEASKSGLTPEELPPLLDEIKDLKRLKLRGLMAIPAKSGDFEEQRAAFHRMRLLYEDLNARGLGLDTLSMGMSNDLEAAVAEGSTLVRVGTDIFGPRQT